MEFDIEIANIVVLDGVRKWYNPKPLECKALEKGLDEVQIRASFRKANVIIPKLNEDELGVKWDDIENIIKQKLSLKNIKVYVYNSG